MSRGEKIGPSCLRYSNSAFFFFFSLQCMYVLGGTIILQMKNKKFQNANWTAYFAGQGLNAKVTDIYWSQQIFWPGLLCEASLHNTISATTHISTNRPIINVDLDLCKILKVYWWIVSRYKHVVLPVFLWKFLVTSNIINKF